MEDKLLTIDDVTKRLLISRQSVHNWIKKGKLRPIKIGRLIRFERCDVDKFINDAKQEVILKEEQS